MKEINVHEWSEQRQRQMVEDEVKRRRWLTTSTELVFDDEKVHQSLKNDRIKKTTEVKTPLP